MLLIKHCIYDGKSACSCYQTIFNMTAVWVYKYFSFIEQVFMSDKFWFLNCKVQNINIALTVWQNALKYNISKVWLTVWQNALKYIISKAWLTVWQNALKYNISKVWLTVWQNALKYNISKVWLTVWQNALKYNISKVCTTNLSYSVVWGTCCL